MTDRKLLIVLLFLMWLIPIGAQENTSPTQTNTTLVPDRIIELDSLTILLYFDAIQQGRVGVVGIETTTDMAFELSVFGQKLPLYRMPDSQRFFAWISVSLDQPIRSHELIVRYPQHPDTPPSTIFFDVISGEFIQQQVTLIDDNTLETLLNPEIELQEIADIFALASSSNRDPLWDETGFQPPLLAELTSPFGAVRVFNGAYNTIHTGWDYQAQMGMPMITTARGRVVFSGTLPIRGNYVLIDHGTGIFSGYAHLSVSYVTTGQLIHAGQIIGLVGSTGRSSSAHAHLEFLAGGNWVDAADFLRMQIPLPSQQF